VKVINEEEAMHLSCAFRASNGWDRNNRKNCQTDVYLEESELATYILLASKNLITFTTNCKSAFCCES
jgi:hypothetical protein